METAWPAAAPATRGWTAADLAACTDWLREFERRNGRPLRVLHYGNVANNGYLNAKLLREAGVDCHVLCADYYDPLATPEWESPHGAPRPRWFVQGPLATCLEFLDATNSGDARRRRAAWRRLRWAELLRAQPSQVVLRRAERIARLTVRPVAAVVRGLRAVRARLVYATLWSWSVGRFLTRRTLRLVGFTIAEPPLGTGSEAPSASSEAPVDPLVPHFAETFPERADLLSAEDLVPWQTVGPQLRDVLGQYDVVEAYGIDPIRAMLSGARPYLAYEHGTLRVFTLGDDPVHRLNALAYRDSDHVFVTNGDCLDYAQRLGIPRFSPMVHPLDVEQHEREGIDEGARLRRRQQADVLLFCPLRHDWEVKGTDVHLRALPRIVEETGGRVVLVLTRWGAELDASIGLLDELGCADHAVWVPPLDRLRLIAQMKAADVVLDQIALPHFGATAPQALAAGVPVVMSYRPESTAWIVDEPAPILSAFDPDGVADAVRTALDPAWRASFAPRARDWVNRFHHPRRVVVEHCRVYRRVLEETT